MATERKEEGRRSESSRREEKSQGTMTVAEAGHKGGQRERELVEEGHKTEEKGNR